MLAGEDMIQFNILIIYSKALYSFAAIKAVCLWPLLKESMKTLKTSVFVSPHVLKSTKVKLKIREHHTASLRIK